MALFGRRKTKIKQLPTLTTGQRGVQEQLLSALQPALGEGGALQQLFGGFDPTRTQEAFQAGVAQPAIQQFQEQIAPVIQERFISSGAGRSSAEQRALGTAGQRLQETLSAQLAQQLQAGEQAGQQAQLQALSQALGFGFKPAFQTVQQQAGGPSALAQGLPGAFGAAGAAFGGPLGGALGTLGGSLLGGLL